MKAKLIALVLGLLLATAGNAQVRVGFGIEIGVPIPVHVDLMVTPPFAGAVWVKGYWVWDEFAGRNVWVRGHWVRERHPVLYHGKMVRHVPNGVAKGWWKKHGRQF